jgi:protein-disulfide isomerase
MNNRPLRVALAFLLASVALTPGCSAQPPAADTQKQIDALRAQVSAMQKDLDEIKALLAPLRGRQAPNPDNLRLDLGDRPVKGAPGAKVTLVELTDYQ